MSASVSLLSSHLRLSRSTLRYAYKHCSQHVAPSTSWRRLLADRASGPGGLYKAPQKIINPWRRQRTALKLRLYRAREEMEDRKRHHYQDKDADESKFETTEDITNYVEQQIEESMRKGGFDNLKNKGKPLTDVGDSIDFYLIRIMKNNGVRPNWLQLMHDIDYHTKIFRKVFVFHLTQRKKNKDYQFKNIVQIQIDNLNNMIDSFNLNRPIAFSHLFRLRLSFPTELRRALKYLREEQEKEKGREKEEKEKDEEEQLHAENDEDNSRVMSAWERVVARLFLFHRNEHQK